MRTVILTTFVFLFAPMVNAQWEPSNGPGFITCLVSNGNCMVAGSQWNGIFISADKGESWKPANKGLKTYHINTLTVIGQNIIAGSDSGLFISNDNAVTWTYKGLSKYGVNAIIAKGSDIFAGTSSGVFLSSDNGDNWSPVNTGLNNKTVLSLALSGTRILAGCSVGTGSMYASDNNGNSWTMLNFISNNPVLSFAVKNNLVFAGTSIDGLFLSNDNGNSWIGLKGLNGTIHSVVCKDTMLYATTLDGIYMSSDTGKSWIRSDSGWIKKDVLALAKDENKLYAGTEDGIPVSANNGLNWIYPKTICLNTKHIISLTTYGNKVFAGTSDQGLYVSADSGNNWYYINTGLSKNVSIDCFTIMGNNIIASAYDSGVIISSDTGKTWKQYNSNIGRNINSFVTMKNHLFAGIYNSVIISSDTGKSWTKLPFFPTAVTTITRKDSTLFVGTYGGGGPYPSGISRSLDKGQNWMEINTGLTNKEIMNLTVSGPNILAGTQAGLFVSQNNGDDWGKNNKTSGYYIFFLNLNNQYILGCRRYDAVQISKDNGNTWEKLSGNQLGFENLTNNGIYVYGGGGGGVWRRSIKDFKLQIPQINNDTRFVNIYPNPATAGIAITSREPIESMIIINIMGQKVWETEYTNKELRFTAELSSLSKGIYFVNIYSGNKLSSQKLILE